MKLANSCVLGFDWRFMDPLPSKYFFLAFQIIIRSAIGLQCYYYGHIQDISPDRGPATVFVEELGKKCV